MTCEKCDHVKCSTRQLEIIKSEKDAGIIEKAIRKMICALRKIGVNI